MLKFPLLFNGIGIRYASVWIKITRNMGSSQFAPESKWVRKTSCQCYAQRINKEGTKMNIIESLNWRYATKEFDASKKVSQENLDVIIESLRLTASSYGLQPWKFLIISNQKIKDSLLEHSWGQKQVVDCSHHIVLCHPKTLDDGNIDAFIASMAKARHQSLEGLKAYEQIMKGSLSNMNQSEKSAWMKNQVYIALGNLLTTCALMRIDACPMEGIVREKYDEILGLQGKGLASAVACPIGYRKETDKYASAPKVRFSKSDVFDFLD